MNKQDIIMNEAFTNLTPPNYLAYPDFRHGMMVRGQIMGADVGLASKVTRSLRYVKKGDVK